MRRRTLVVSPTGEPERINAMSQPLFPTTARRRAMALLLAALAACGAIAARADNTVGTKYVQFRTPHVSTTASLDIGHHDTT